MRAEPPAEANPLQSVCVCALLINRACITRTIWYVPQEHGALGCNCRRRGKGSPNHAQPHRGERRCDLSFHGHFVAYIPNSGSARCAAIIRCVLWWGVRGGSSIRTKNPYVELPQPRRVREAGEEGASRGYSLQVSLQARQHKKALMHGARECVELRRQCLRPQLDAGLALQTQLPGSMLPALDSTSHGVLRQPAHDKRRREARPP